MIPTFISPSHLKVTMWITKVKNKATGKTYEQLQYEQVMDR